MPEGPFDKDFGYLMPFLDKVAAAASNLSDPAAREELKKMMTDEKSRWARIRQLLAGAAGQAAGRAPSPVEANPAGAASTRPHASADAKEPLSFTVGSLRPRPR
ncbi:MAG TPA: hypothetical protein VJZ26_06770 [Blastocatellia bacterium]|nr:hypothetical protein [Blastocatellia bacterium]